VSHLHERKEKVCLNCGAQLTGRYCPDCGQENLEPKESFGHLLKHFFEDFTHFDGKLFGTLRPLLLKPGFLTKEYVAGRRASYLNPIRMYLFISAMFFLLLVTFFINSKHDAAKEKRVTKETSALRGSLGTLREKVNEIDSSNGGDSAVYYTLADGSKMYEKDYPRTVESYDSLQKVLPDSEKDSRLERYLARKSLKTMQYNKEHPGDTNHVIREKFYHSLPYMLFITLPLIALLLKLLYIRKRKDFYYVSHIIFTLHFYCFMFLLLLLSFTITELGHWGEVVGNVIVLGGLIYLFLAMRRFYGQSNGKTFLKFLLLLVFGLGSISIITLVFIINTFLNVAS
jgi:ribosomal protein L40E/uncharacterized membrane protein